MSDKAAPRDYVAAVSTETLLSTLYQTKSKALEGMNTMHNHHKKNIS